MRRYDVCFIVRENAKDFWIIEAKENLKTFRVRNEGAWGQSELRVILKNVESCFWRKIMKTSNLRCLVFVHS
jgi:hypothetical protein